MNAGSLAAYNLDLPILYGVQALEPTMLLVDCSTVHPSFSRQMAKEAQSKQVRFLDAPVAGSKNQARTYALTGTSGFLCRVAWVQI